MAKKEIDKPEESNPQAEPPGTNVPVVDNSEPMTAGDSEPVIEVKASVLEKLVTDMEDLKQSNEALRSTVSKTRLEEAEDRQGVDVRPRVSFKILDGKVVIGWPTSVGDEKKNEIIHNPSNGHPIGEILKSVYYYADGTKSDLIDQLQFIRVNDLAYARVIGGLESDEPLLEFEDKSLVPEPIKINKHFWNA